MKAYMWRGIPFRERFEAQYEYEPNTGCHIWIGALTGRGYGTLWRDGHYPPAHRVAYEFARGPIPPGLTVDHLCRNRRCVNPAHLEAVTSQENILRGVGVTAINARKARCYRGHEFTGEWRGRRTCRECGRLKTQAYRDRLASREVAHAR